MIRLVALPDRCDWREQRPTLFITREDGSLVLTFKREEALGFSCWCEALSALEKVKKEIAARNEEYYCGPNSVYHIDNLSLLYTP